MPRLLIFLSIIFLCHTVGCSDMSEDNKKTETIETASGSFVAHSKTVPDVPQLIQPVTGDDLVELRSFNDQSKEFLYTYLGSGIPPTLESYDLAFERWQASELPEHTSKQVIDILGGVLGNYCIDNLDMEWVIVTDEFGTDYGVRHLKSEVMAFPFSSVVKRIEKKESDFMVAVFEITKHTIKNGEARARPTRSND